MNVLQKIEDKFSPRWKEASDKISDFFNFLKNITFQRWAIAIFLCVGLTFILAPRIYKTSPEYRHGMIAPENIKADRDFLVEDVNSTQQKRAEAMAEVRAVYDFDAEMPITISTKLNEAFSDLGANRGTEVGIALLEKSLGVALSPQEAAFLTFGHYKTDLPEKLSRVLFSFYGDKLITQVNFQPNEHHRGITIVNGITRAEETLKDVSSVIQLKDRGVDRLLEKQIAAVFKNDSSDTRKFAFSLLRKLLEPNLTTNQHETEKRKMSAAEEVKPVYFQVQKNEMIVREGEKIGYPELAKLNAFHKTKAENQMSAMMITAGIFLTTLFLTLLLYFWRTRNWLKTPARSNADFLVFALVALLQIFLIKAGMFIATAVNQAFPFIPTDACYYAVPFACGAMIMAVLINRNLAMIMSIFIAFLNSLLFDENIVYPLFGFLGSVAASYHIVKSHQRSMFLKVGLFLSLINMGAIVSLNLLAGQLFDDLVIRLALGILGGVVTGVLVAGITPVFESVFGFITDIKLLELANLNQPLFQRMIIEAPGTYHHSIVVASLVESAAEAIGANALLAKVSAYYHDIGKLAKPHYFIENQLGYENRHDKLSPKMSSLVIISHVKEGCELAAKVKLGRPIINIIREHHGTSLVSYFYDKAKKDKDESIRSLTENDFRYPGPKPQTKEAGLVMLGDIIEASSRSLTNPTPARIKSLVRERIERVYMDGQLDDCELTLKNLNTIADTFTRILTGIFHHRVEYPETMAKDTNGKKESNENSHRKSAEVN